MGMSTADKEFADRQVKNFIVSLGLRGAIIAASIFLIPDKFVYTDKDKGEVSASVLNARKVMLGLLLIQTLSLPFTVLNAARSLQMLGRAKDDLSKAYIILGVLKNIPYIVTSFISIIKAALYYEEHKEFPTNMGQLVPPQALKASTISYIALNALQQGGIPALRE